MVKKMMGLLLCSLLAAPAALAAEPTVVRVGGGGAATSTLFESIGPYLEKATGITLVRRPSSPGIGLAELISGSLDLAIAAVSFDSMVEGATKAGTVVDRSKLVVKEIGINKTVLFIHPGNKVGKLTGEQIKGIFTGKITNWKEVGGDDSAIVVVWGAGTPGQNALFSREVLKGEPVVKDSLGATNYANIREIVSATPEAVGIDPFGMADATVKVIHIDPELTSPILAVTIGKPAPAVQKVIDYVTGEGRQYTRQ